MTEYEYQSKRKRDAIPRWREAYQMRQRGMKLREIAERFFTCPARISRMICNYEEAMLKQTKRNK